MQVLRTVEPLAEKPGQRHQHQSRGLQRNLKNFIVQYKRNSVRKSSQLVDISDTTLWRVVKKDLRVNLFHSKCVQPLTEAHKEQRMKFWRCLLEQPNPEIFIINDIWTDEKYFCLHQKPKHVQRQVYASNPSTINEVVAIVKQYAVRCSEDVLKRVALNVLKRAKLVISNMCWRKFQAAIRVKISLLITSSTLQQYYGVLLSSFFNFFAFWGAAENNKILQIHCTITSSIAFLKNHANILVKFFSFNGVILQWLFLVS